MISKYVAIGSIIAIMGLGATIWYLNGQIEERDIKIGQLEVQLISCEASNANLVKGIEAQNTQIDKFNTILVSKNKKLENIADENKVLQAEVQTKNLQIDKVQLNSCEETMDWMLQEALDEKVTNSTTTTD